MRSQDEVLERIEHVQAAGDPLGFAFETLVFALDYEHAQKWIKDGVTPDEWMADVWTTDEQLLESARGYADFAWGKATDHRGISASRSVAKLTEYAWLAGRDDVVEAMESAPYAQYGAPKLLAFCAGMGFPAPETTAAQRMSQGLVCREDGCDDGCGT